MAVPTAHPSGSCDTRKIAKSDSLFCFVVFFLFSVLVTHTDAVKISDFGTSKELSDKSTKMSFAGTVAWMAPEVIRNEPVSEKVDIWWVVLMLMYLCLLFSHLVSQHSVFSALFASWAWRSLALWWTSPFYFLPGALNFVTEPRAVVEIEMTSTCKSYVLRSVQTTCVLQ